MGEIETYILGLGDDPGSDRLDSICNIDFVVENW